MPDGVTTRSRTMEDQLSHHSERLDRLESALADMKQSHADSMERLQQTLSELLLRYNRPERSESAPPFFGSSLPFSIPPPPIRYEKSDDPSPPIVSPAPQHQIPSLGEPLKPFFPPDLQSSEPLKPVTFFPDSLDPISPNPTSLGCTTTAPPSANSSPLTARDPDVHQEISYPNLDDPVEELDAAPPPTIDPNAYQAVFDPHPDEPVDELNKDQPSILAHGLIFTVSERLASFDSAFKLFVSTYPFHTNKKSLMMFDPGSLSAHWMARNGKEKVFDARQAQGGGRSVLFYINVLHLLAQRHASGGDGGLMRCWCSEDALQLCLAMASRDVLPWSMMISCSPLDVFVTQGMKEFLDRHLEDKVHLEGGTNVAGLISCN